MKFSRFLHPSGSKTRFVPGDWNYVDDISGHPKKKASTAEKQWDGRMTGHASPRHEQDFLRSTPERIRTPWTRPDQSDTFVNQLLDITNPNFVVTTDWTLGSSWSIANGFASYLAGSTDTMFQDIDALDGVEYEITYTIFNYVGGGSCTISLGTASGTARTTNGTFTEKITSSGANPSRLTFTPASGVTSFNIDKILGLRF